MARYGGRFQPIQPTILKGFDDGSRIVVVGALDVPTTVNAPAVVYVVQPDTLSAPTTLNAPQVIQVVKPGTLSTETTLNEPFVTKKLHTLVEDFADALTDPPWNPGSIYSLDSGRLRIQLLENAGEILFSRLDFNLEDSSIFFKVETPAGSDPDMHAIFYVDINGGPYVVIRRNGDDFEVDTEVLGLQFSEPYSAVDHAWWRVREESGTLYVDTSANGVDWVNKWSDTSPSELAPVFVAFTADYDTTTPDPAEYVYFDNINVPTQEVEPDTLSAPTTLNSPQVTYVVAPSMLADTSVVHSPNAWRKRGALHTLTEDFSGGSIDADVFINPDGRFGDLAFEVVSGRLRNQSSATDGGAVVTRDVYDLTGSQVFLEVDVSSATQPNVYMDVEVIEADGAGLLVTWYDPTAVGDELNVWFGTLAQTDTFEYDPVDHRWWRWREASGTFYFDVSPDGSAWTNLTSRANSGLTNQWTDLTRTYVALLVIPADAANFVYFDNINTAVVVPGTLSVPTTLHDPTVSQALAIVVDTLSAPTTLYGPDITVIATPATINATASIALMFTEGSAIISGGTDTLVEPAVISCTTTVGTPNIVITHVATTISCTTTVGDPTKIVAVEAATIHATTEITAVVEIILIPDTIAGTTTVGDPTRVIIATPATIAATTAVNTPNIAIEHIGGTVSGTTTIGSPGITVTIGVLVIAGTTSVGVPQFPNVFPSTVAATTYIPEAANYPGGWPGTEQYPGQGFWIIASADVFAVTIAAVTTVGSPVVEGDNSMPTPATIDAVATVGAPTIEIRHVAGTVTGTTSVNSPGITLTIENNTVAGTTTLDAPTITASATVTPAVIAAVTTLDAVTITASSTFTPGTVSGSTAVNTPNIEIVHPGGTITGTTSVNSPGITLTIENNTVPGTTTLDAPTITASATVTPASVDCSTTVGSPGVSPTIGLNTIAGTTTLDAPTITASALVTPDTINAVTTLDDVLIPQEGTPEPETIDATASVGNPTITASGNTAPASVGLAASVGNTTITASGNTEPGSIGVTTTVGAPGVSPTIGIGSIAGSVSVNGVTLTADGNAGVATVSIGASVGGQGITASAQFAPVTVGLTAAVNDPTALAIAITTPASVSAIVSVGAPTILGSSNAVNPVTISVITEVGASIIILHLKQPLNAVVTNNGVTVAQIEASENNTILVSDGITYAPIDASISDIVVV